MSKVFVDTSAYYALANEIDEDHEAATRIMHQLTNERAELITTNYIVAETHTLLLNRIGYSTVLEFLRSTLGIALLTCFVSLISPRLALADTSAMRTVNRHLRFIRASRR